MSEPIAAGLGLFFVVFCFGVIYLATKPPKPHHLIQFRLIFGYWPEKNEHLRRLQRSEMLRIILGDLAKALSEANKERDEYLAKIKKGEVDYRSAAGELPLYERESQRRYRRFDSAQAVANIFGFSVPDHFGIYLTEDLKPEDSGRQRFRGQGVGGG